MEDVRWLSDEEQALWRAILHAERAVDRAIDLRLQENSRISTADFSVLVTLSEAPEMTVRMRELGDSLNWDRSRTSHQVTRMERRGLVQKLRCECDNRGIDVSLTDEGYSIVQKAAPDHVRLVRRVVFDVLGDDINSEAVISILNKVAEAAEKESGKASC